MARGSTLLNITQQVAASIGTALFSVMLTNELKDSKSVQAAWRPVADGDPGKPRRAAGEGRPVADQLPGAARPGPVDMADAFATVFVVATVLVACCLIPAAFLPPQEGRPGRPDRDDWVTDPTSHVVRGPSSCSEGVAAVVAAAVG